MSKTRRERCNTKVITWEELVTHEPELNDVLVEARSIKAKTGSYFCNHDVWAFGWEHHIAFKKRIDRLVGFGSRHHISFLATCQAYDVVLRTLMEVLPPCCKCGCVNADGQFVC